jgi:hypothetical protein
MRVSLVIETLKFEWKKKDLNIKTAPAIMFYFNFNPYKRKIDFSPA